jgi:hypothetical protein
MIMSACAVGAGARYLQAVYGATVRFHGGNLNDQPACCALPPASGPEIVRQEAAENCLGALGGKPFLADLAGNMRCYRGGRSPYRRRARCR